MSSASLVHRLKGNATASIYGKMGTVFQQLALVPLFLRSWGLEYYSEWLVLSAIPSALALSSLGVGSASQIRISHLLGKGQRDRACILLSTSVAIVLFVLIVVCIGSFVVLSSLASTSTSLIGAGAWVCCFLFASLFVVQSTQPLDAFWFHRSAANKALWFRGHLTVLEVVIMATMLLLGGNAFALALALFVARAAWALCYFLVSGVTHKINFEFYPQFELIPSLLGKGLGFQLSSLWQAIYFQGSLVLAQSVLGPGGAALWGTVRALARSGNQALVIVNQSITPELQAAVARNNITEAKRLHRLGLWGAGVLASGVALVLSLGGNGIYTLWTKLELDTPYLFPLVSISLVLNSLWWTSSSVQRVFDRPWFLNTTGVCAALLSVASTYWLAEGLGIYAFAVGAIVFEGIMAISVLHRSMIYLDTALAETPAIPNEFVTKLS